MYKGFFDAFSTILKMEGVSGLYAGYIPGLIGVSHGMVQFAVYERMKKYFKKSDNNNNSNNNNNNVTYRFQEYIFMAAGTYIYIYIHLHIHTYIHTYIHAYMHT